MDKINIIKKLGSGGNSKAFLGKEISTGRLVTVKMCKTEGEDISGCCNEKNEIERVNLENEANILASLDHECIPKLIKRNRESIILDYVPGISLEKVLLTKGVFAEKEAVRIALEIAGILRYLHGRREAIIYRDLKPANVVLRPDGHISLIDFGAARRYEFGQKSDTLNLGTLGFAAPEQFGNLGQTDPRTDIYCFGMTLLQLISGVDTKDTDAVAGFKKKGIRGVSSELLGIIDKCTRPDMDDRFMSVKEIETALLTYPGKVRLRKIGNGIKVVAAAAGLSIVISGCIMQGESIKNYAVNDIEVRMPAVRERLGFIRGWIEEQFEALLGCEVLK